MSNTFLGRAASFLKRQARAVRMARRGNMALIFALSIIPVLVTGGAGIDLARSLAVRAKLYAAVDAAALAVASKAGITQTQANTLAQQYFNANFTLNSSFGTPNPISVVINGQQVDVSSNINMPTTIMGVVGIQNVNLTAASRVVWGQTKIWVGLALDNTGSMCEPSSSPCTNPSGSKINALKTATHSLLTLFQNVSATAGDVQVSLVPFNRDVNVGAANAGAAWIDWTEWDEDHGTCTPSQDQNGNTLDHKSECLAATVGTCTVGGTMTQSSCSTKGTCSVGGFTTQSTCTNASTGGVCSISGNTTLTTCQAAFTGGCNKPSYTTQSTCLAAPSCSNPIKTTSSSCTGQKACTNKNYTTQSNCQNAGYVWNYGTWLVPVWTPKVFGVWTAGVWTAATWTGAAWTPDHTGWTGCVMDRGTVAGPTSSTSNTGYDLVNTTPGTPPESKFPVENYNQCPVQMMGLGYDWTALNAKVDAMDADGNTNQTIGLAWAWQSLTQGAPLNPPSLPSATARHIIILSDGENTQNRWYSSRQSIDDRMHLLCNNAKNDDITIWSVFVNIAGGGGNAASMQDCASGGALGGHYCEATTTAQINACFAIIGQQITNLRVAQ